MLQMVRVKIAYSTIEKELIGGYGKATPQKTNMIPDRKRFDINNKCAIEKLIIKTPLRPGLDSVFQDHACFIYFKEGEVFYTSPRLGVVSLTTSQRFHISDLIVRFWLQHLHLLHLSIHLEKQALLI